MEAFNGKKIFVAGTAGFIGWNLSKRLLKESADITVIGIDNMNDCYDVSIKKYRLKELEQFQNFTFVKADMSDKAVLQVLFQIYKPDIVVNLAAQAGVRYSITNLTSFTISLRLVGIPMTTEQGVWSIWCMLLPVLFTAATVRFRSAQMIKWTIRFLFMRLPKRAMSSLRIRTRSFMTFRLQGCVSLRYMVLRAAICSLQHRRWYAEDQAARGIAEIRGVV